MLSRSVALAVLIGVSLFSLRAHARSLGAYARSWGTDAGVVAPLAVPTDAPPIKVALSPHVLANAPSWIITDTLPTAADLGIQVAELAPALPGGTTAFTLTIRNQGPGPATGIVASTVLAKGLTPAWTRPEQAWCDRQERSTSCAIGEVRPSDPISVTLDLSVGGTQTHVTNTQLAGVMLDPPPPNCAIDSSAFSLTCRLAKLAAGAETQIRIDARLDASVSGPLANTATVTADEPDPNPSNNQITFTTGASSAAPATMTPVPAATDLVIQADGPITVTAGQPFTYTFSITNRGELDATGVHFEDPLPSTANVHGYSPGLPLCEQRGNVLACSLRDPDSGATVTFNVAVTGNGDQRVRISPDPLMPGWPICTVLKEKTWLRIVNCEFGTLKPGQTTHVELGMVAIGVQERTMANGAFIKSREADVNSSDNAITTTMTVQVRADLSVRSAVSGPVAAGKPLSYTLTVANHGPSDAEGVVVTDTLPMHTRFVSAIPSQGNDCRQEPKDGSPGALICRLGAIPGGARAMVTVVLAADQSLTPALTQTIEHLGKAMSEQTDPDLSNNEFLEAIPVSAGAKE